MKFKSLLSLALIAGASLQASAWYTIELRDNVNTAVDGGGHMDFPVVEGTRTFNDDGSIKNYGTPQRNEDGSITYTSTDLAKGAACYVRTMKLTEAIPKEYNILVVEYKSNLPQNNLFIYFHEGYNDYANVMNGNVFEATDTYKKTYMVIDRNATTWGDDPNGAGKKDYNWIGVNNPADKGQWVWTLKDFKLMNLEEAKADMESSEVSGPINEFFVHANADWTWDFDNDMGSEVCVKTGGNPVWFGAEFSSKTLPATHTTYKFDYKYVGEAYKPTLHLGTPNPAYSVEGPAIEPIATDDPYGEEWKTYSFDFGDKIKEFGFAQTPFSNHRLWVQSHKAPEGATMWVKNARWENPNETGLNTIVADKNADTRIFNLMGVEVKGDLTPGLYIQGGKKFIVR